MCDYGKALIVAKMKCGACGYEGDGFFLIRVEDEDGKRFPVSIYRDGYEPEPWHEAYEARLLMCPRRGTVRVGGINGLDDPEIEGTKQAEHYKVVHLAGLEAHGPGAIECAEKTLNRAAADYGYRRRVHDYGEANSPARR